MKIEIIDKGKKPVEWAKFVVEGIDVSLANAMRQAIISEAPVLAIEDVSIRMNSSALYDEVLALRLGLVPIKTDESFDSEGAGNTVTFTLKAKGPKWVYSGDMESSDRKISPVFDNIPVAYLGEGQELDLDAMATIGIGADHMKWQAGFAIMQAYPKIILGKGKEIQYADGVASKDALVSKDGKIKDLAKWTLGVAKKQIASGAEISEETDKFIFYVESFGQMPLALLVERATERFAKKFGEFRKAVEELK
jgi:DNA-directed RNA polymerase subunit D